MFYLCKSLKLSNTKTGEYTQEYRIPSSGTGTTASNALTNMFASTGGTFTGTPSINTTYYLSTDNMIVRDTEVATLNSYVGSIIDNSVSNPLNITGATVGQIAKITAVDESGKPTAWESADMPSGGGGSGGTDISLSLTSASVGQTIKVKAIDGSGKPTAWDALDRTWKVAETYLLKDMTFPAVISIPQGKDSLLMLSGTDITPDKNTDVNITMGTVANQSGYSTRWSFTQKMHAHGWGCGMFLELNYIRDGTAHFWMRQTGWEGDSHRNQIFEDKPTGETNRFFYVLSVDNSENINKNTTANIILYTRDAL